MTNGDHEAPDSAARAGDRYARMEWTEEGEEIFTLIVGDYQWKVWHIRRSGTWGAMLIQRGLVTASYNFTTRVEAQAWCEQQIPKAPER